MNKQARWVAGVRTLVGDMAGREARLRVGNMIGSSREKGKKKGSKGGDPSENKNKNEGEERRQVTDTGWAESKVREYGTRTEPIKVNEKKKRKR